MKVSCIICAYNEGPRIRGVLTALRNHPLINDVAVVDDGSKDDTARIVAQFPNVQLIIHPTNRGKSAALVTGMRATRGEIVLLLDADLKGLTSTHITSLVTPLLENSADMTISIRENSLLVYKMIGLDFVSGERSFNRSLIEQRLDEIAILPSFGLEIFINQCAIEHALRIHAVPLKNVIAPRKSDKMGWWRGVWADALMIRDILKAESVGNIVLQNYRIVRLFAP